ncbi:hypothetical protein RIF29_08306 [Crotalaria pallida]|uniref:Outer envelope pore protein 37, chloroplastic n=2 Tax=50 kb inversion clade TaxID=2231393 RepID=A0AAN9J870_CROPI
MKSPIENPNYTSASAGVVVVDSPPPPPPPARRGGLLRVTSEFDSESASFLHKVSCKLLDSVAKLKLSFQNNIKGQVSEPQLRLSSKHLSLLYDLEDRNALINACFDVGPSIQVSASHDLKANQGHLSLLANLPPHPGYALQLSTPLPSSSSSSSSLALALPKATFRFPIGEVSLEEQEQVEEEEEEREEQEAPVFVKNNNNLLSVSGNVKAQFLNGLCTAHYKDQDLKLRYSYKDDEFSFIPTLSLPSNALSFAFKRRLTPSHKFSYWYNCDSNYWSAVYKRTYGKDFKFKAGYDSEVRLGWASLWVGDEGGKAKTAPMKMKVQFMLQVPQDDIKSSVLMFRVKKRWDI